MTDTFTYHKHFDNARKNVDLKRSKIFRPQALTYLFRAGTNVPENIKVFFVLYELCKVHMVLSEVKCTVITFFPTEDLKRKKQQYIVYHRRMKACTTPLRQ